MKRVGKFDRSEATGTARNQAIEEDGLGEMFKDLSPKQKAIGLLIGKILNKETKAYDQIEAAFKWFEVEHNDGVQLTYSEKMMVIFQCVGHFGCDQPTYNLIRKMYLTVANRS
jgi:hypothetical protein